MDALPLLLALLSVPDPFADLSRFPPYPYTCLQHDQAMAEVKYLERLVVPTRSGLWAMNSLEGFLSPLPLYSPERQRAIDAYRAAHYRLSCWRALWHASSHDPLDVRLAGLRRLRLLLSESDWAAGQMP